MSSTTPPPDPPPNPQPEPTPARRSPERLGPRGVMERGFLRVVATVGIVGIGVGIGAILADNKVQGWIIGLVVAVVTIVLTALLRSTRPLRAPRKR